MRTRRALISGALVLLAIALIVLLWDTTIRNFTSSLAATSEQPVVSETDLGLHDDGRGQDEVGSKLQSARNDGTSPKDDLLTMEQTLGMIFSNKRFHVLGLYRNANPKSKQYVYDILRNEGLIKYHPSAFLALGYIGDDSDARFLEEHLRTNYSGLLSSHAKDSVVSIFQALGIMSRRGIKQAREILERMTTFAYWKNPKFKWFPDAMPDRRPFEDTTLEWVMLGYALSESENVEQKSKSLVAQVRDPERRKFVAFITSTKRMHGYARQIRDAEQRPLPEQLVADLPGYFNGNLEQPGPAIPPRRDQRPQQTTEPAAKAPQLKIESQDELDDEFVAQMIQQAQDEYERLTGKIADGHTAQVMPQLLDDGKPLTPKELQRQRAELQQEIQSEVEVLEAIEALDPEHDDFQVQRITQVSSSGEVVSETVRLTFDLVGTRALRERMFTDAGRGSPRTISSSGGLLVLMKRIDGKWYWNPFGW